MNTVRQYEVISTLICLSKAQMHEAGARVVVATLLCVSDAHTAGFRGQRLQSICRAKIAAAAVTSGDSTPVVSGRSLGHGA